MALNYITGSVTQGSADAFATTDITTPLSSSITNQAMRIRELLIERPTAGANGSVVELALSRVSAPTAIPALTALGLIWRGRWDSYFTTSGATNQQAVIHNQYNEEDDILVVETALSFSIDSASTSASNVSRIRIGYEMVKINENAYLALRLNALAL
jgi:hypothetical protein